jgi:hypothetical protein
MKFPIGVSTYGTLPDSLKNSLPSIEQLQSELKTTIDICDDDGTPK